jgi:CMP/dCMP kinase
MECRQSPACTLFISYLHDFGKAAPYQPVGKSLPASGKVLGGSAAFDVVACPDTLLYGTCHNQDLRRERHIMIIAIDGPAASGKGTLARRIAAHYNLSYLDTGALYRAVARDVRRMNGKLDDPQTAASVARNLDASSLSDPSLRDPGVGDAASIVAKIPEVRAALLEFQRDFARQEPGAVLDGRDIGTVVLPDADAKIYVVADTEVRAKRRFLELQNRGEDVSYVGVLEVIRRRDDRDMNRDSAPLKAADDALLLDTSGLDIERAFAAAVALIERKIGRLG